MAKTLYTAKATVTGGRGEGHGKTDDGRLEVDLRLPEEMGGPPAGASTGDGSGGTNPEQLFAIGYAACFEGAVGVVGRRRKVETGDVSIDSSVNLHPTPEGGFQLSVGLDVSIPQAESTAQAKEIVAAAHEVCPYSNATRGNIDVTLTANGEPV